MIVHAETAEPYEPPYGRLGPRPLPRYRTRPVSLREHVLAAGRDRHLAQGFQSRDDLTLCLFGVRLAGRRPKPAADGVIGLTWLIAQWPEGEDEPVRHWISNVPADSRARDLVRLAKLRWRIEHDYRELKTALGLDHFEGRSFTGWHRHFKLSGCVQPIDARGSAISRNPRESSRGLVRARAPAPVRVVGGHPARPHLPQRRLSVQRWQAQFRASSGVPAKLPVGRQVSTLSRVAGRERAGGDRGVRHRWGVL